TMLLGFALLLVVPRAHAATPNLQFDHVWIVVHPDAPEHAALERAGFRISPDVNHHDGQGTSSIAAEFQNSYIELMWPYPKVSVAPGREAVVDKFRNRMLWRTTGWCPIGIGLHRTSADNDSFPFPTWTISMPWMPPTHASKSSRPAMTPRARLFLSSHGHWPSTKQKIGQLSRTSRPMRPSSTILWESSGSRVSISSRPGPTSPLQL